jgi:5'-3' exonuclease
MRTLLVDADIYAYRIAAANQQVYDWDGDGNQIIVTNDLSEATDQLDGVLRNLQADLEADRLIVCLTSPDNWRKTVLPTYKANRVHERPVLLEPIRQHLIETHTTYARPTLEADDLLGILATHPRILAGERIIVSQDKDLKAIPGWLFNPDKHTAPVCIEEPQADHWHLLQTLTGDPVDGYSGCPGIGPVKALKWLPEFSEDMWSTVVDCYASKGLTEEDALVQARVARICRHTDYDFKNKQVKLWTPH